MRLNAMLAGESRRLSRFGAIGLLATLSHLLVSLGLIGWLRFSLLLAHASGFAFAFFVSLIGHARFTFGVNLSPGVFLRFSTVTIAAFALSSWLAWQMRQWQIGVDELVAAIAALSIPLLTYVAHACWAFRDGSGKKSAA